MSTQHKHEQADVPAATDASVAHYLRAHPDFFSAHPEVLTDMVVPHPSGAAISLIERQVAALREQNRKLKRQLQELVQIARDNDRLGERMQRLTLALMECTSLEEVFIALHDGLRNDFHADAVVLRLMVKPGQPIGPGQIEALPDALFTDPDDPAWGAFRGVLKGAKPLCGVLNAVQLHHLFGDEAATISSAVLIPLTTPATSASLMPSIGLLAIGSHDAERFHAGMGTHFLDQMSELISCAIRPYLA
ncbi:MAG: DUF484 family protein [Gammaproteobacteria bacterium]|nr:DUF484 family protein [Gammaproteobacteria bacterium]